MWVALGLIIVFIVSCVAHEKMEEGDLKTRMTAGGGLIAQVIMKIVAEKAAIGGAKNVTTESIAEERRMTKLVGKTRMLCA